MNVTSSFLSCSTYNKGFQEGLICTTQRFFYPLFLGAVGRTSILRPTLSCNVKQPEQRELEEWDEGWLPKAGKRLPQAYHALVPSRFASRKDRELRFLVDWGALCTCRRVGGLMWYNCIAYNLRNTKIIETITSQFFQTNFHRQDRPRFRHRRGRQWIFRVLDLGSVWRSRSVS